MLPGSDSSRATEIAPAWEAPRLLPDGRLVFTGHDGYLWRANADGSERLRLGPGFYKAVASDGRSLVFSHEGEGGSQIWRADTDGRNRVRITHGQAATQPDTSPDGQWIVYTTAVDGALWKVPLAGGEPVRLADGFIANPSISPNGRWVAARVKDRADAPWEAALIPMAGGAIARKLPLPPGNDLWDLRFSRDGRAVDVAVNKDTIGNLWRLPLDGGPPIS
jgi:Tol biopolymer transport system component